MANVKQFKKGENTSITRNFSSKEFDCSCTRETCKITLVDVDHVALVQRIRDDLGKSIKINSGFRCPEHNKAEGGATNSRHLISDATDIVIKGMTPNEVADYCDKLGVNGLGRYDTFTHIDSRPLGSKGKARWDFRKSTKMG
jgi:uncharacterized protein YcbK (DUF882 family)